jgi:parallel beta-helix repeat protein
VIQGNYIGTNAAGSAALANGTGVLFRNSVSNTLLGGASAGASNIISGNSTDGIGFEETGIAQVNFANNTIQGNFIGVNPAGTAALPNLRYGIRVREIPAGVNRILSNIVSGNGADGLNVTTSVGLLIRGNRIGTNAAGMAAIPNAGSGIRMESGNVRNTITGNTISGNGMAGIALLENFSPNFITGNLIGTRADGRGDLGNFAAGIYIESFNQRIGGVAAGAGNRIANNNVGILATFGEGNQFLGNSILGNEGLGIDLYNRGSELENTGVNFNDPGDGDGGTNTFQNFPVLNAALPEGTTGTRVSGTLDTEPASLVIIEFYATPSCHMSGHGEGITLVGRTRVLTDNTGYASFDVIFNRPLRAASRITATATAQYRGTSEFSRCLTLGTLLLPRPVLQQPAANTTLADSSPTLRWRAVNGATAYRVEVSRTTTFARNTLVEVQYVVGANTVDLPDLPDEGVFYWRVAGVNAAGEQGAWSAPRRFTLNLP